MTRSLKIETAGDFYRRKTFPKVRIQGQWLARAGFTAGERVELVVVEQGRIELRVRRGEL